MGAKGSKPGEDQAPGDGPTDPAGEEEASWEDYDHALRKGVRDGRTRLQQMV